MLTWRHFEINSDHLFSNSSWLGWLMISSFSWRHSNHLLVILSYPGTDYTIDHFKDVVFLYLSFISYTYFEWVMSFAFFLLLNDVSWLYYHFLKFASAFFWYTLSRWTVVEAMHLCIISLVWQLPSIRKLFLFLYCIGLLMLFFDVTFLL